MQNVLDWFAGIFTTNATNLIVYGAIVAVTLIGVFKCLIPLWGTTHSLHHAIRRLQSEAGEAHEVPVWQERRFCGRRLKGIWLRFLQNAEQLDRRGLPCNVEDYINDDTVTHGPGNATLAEMIPNLLTSLGILGTFIGMTSGLGALDTTTNEAMMGGINTLLSGMSFAFGTSVAGVSCSIVFNMLNRIAQGSSYRAIDEFVESFTQLAMQRPLDNDVQVIIQNQDRNHLLAEVKDNVTTQVPAAIQTAVTRALQPVSASMDRFLIGATRAQVEGVAHVVESFVAQMNESLSGQFYALGETMTSINQQQVISSRQVQQAMAGTQQMLASMQQINGISSDVLHRFEHFLSELTDARNRDERFETDVAKLLDRLKTATDQQSALINLIRDNQNVVAESSARYMKQAGESLGGLTAAAEAVQNAGRELSRSYTDFTGNVTGGINESLRAFSGTMKSAVDSLSDQIGRLEKAGGSVDTASLSEMQRLLTDILTTVEKALPAKRTEA